MQTAIILHGMPSKAGYYDPNRQSQSNEHWIPWLQHELIIRDILTQTPELPKPYEPVYADWLKVFEHFEVGRESILVGHSCGAGFLIRWLSETNTKIHKLILVAPFLDPEKTIKDSFFDFEIDPNLVSKTDATHILFSTDDDKDIADSIEKLRDSINGYKYHEFSNLGHFVMGSMGTEKFPELLELALE